MILWFYEGRIKPIWVWVNTRESHGEHQAGERGETEKSEQQTGQERVGGKREEELFSDCDMIPVTWKVWGRQGERNFSWGLSGALDKVRIDTLGSRGKMFHQACEWSFHSGKVITGGEAAYNAPVTQFQRCKNGRSEAGKVGIEDQEGREKENLREQEKGMLKVSTHCAVQSSSLLTPSYNPEVSTFPSKSSTTPLCGGTLVLEQQRLAW